ncbi:MAG: hypothetical protein K0S18_650 [Anaerocolumna sp.]|jgi:hypothetical protein|nr:hypothetical protein [Anaerocolumna sp.]
MKDSIYLNNNMYDILLYENNYIFHPDYFGVTSTWLNDPNFRYQSSFELKDYQLLLKNFIVSSDKEYPEINGIMPVPNYSEENNNTVIYNNLMEPMKYTGGIIIGNSIINEYGFQKSIPCFSYKNVSELIFRDGRLITTVDHSRDMLRIRKNIDLGFRSLYKKQDVKCIERFVKASFIGEYCYTDKFKMVKTIKSLKNTYIEKLKKQHNRIVKKSFELIHKG